MFLPFTLGAVLGLLPSLSRGQSTPSTRVHTLISSLTPTEKISLLHGITYSGTQNFAGYIPPLPQHSIPAFQLTDGESGVNGIADATAIPSQLNVGATFSRNLSHLHGVVGGRESFLLNSSVLLAPRVNILRDPFTGNFWQSYSEDAFLNAELGVQSVLGIQSEGTLANTKQIGASSTGASSGDANSEVDLQVLHEIYLSAHEALVKAGVATMMCSYGAVNGVQSCESEEILGRTVRGDWAFQGVVMSDWGATHSTMGSLVNGMDWEMGSLTYYYGDALYDAVYTYGNLSESYVDRALGHVLGTYERFGILDGGGSQRGSLDGLLEVTEIDGDVKTAHQDAAYEIAVASGVLLRNSNSTLPLAKDASIAVIGPTGLQLTNGAGYAERAWGFEERKISPLQALQNVFNTSISIPTAVGVDVHGTPIPAPFLRTGNGTAGLTRSDGTIDASLNFNFADSTALPGDVDYTWTGQLLANTSGMYRLSLQRFYPHVASSTINDTSYSLFAVGAFTLDTETYSSFRLLGDGGLRPWSGSLPTPDGWDNRGVDVYLEAGWHNISVSAPRCFGDDVSVRLSWVTPDQRQTWMEEAVEVARGVDVPVVFAYNESPAQEGMRLLEGHDELIERVAEVNGNVVVVLFNAEPVEMSWLESVAAVVWMGHPGQEGARASVDLLSGERNPRGRLPVTYPLSANQSVTRNPAYPERVDTENGTAVFSEGINSGYRWYLYSNTTTLFPFGFGLSYTSFDYSSLNITSESDGNVTVSFTVQNTGSVTGVDVPQVYIGAPEGAEETYPGIQFPVSKLVGFDDIEVEVGAEKTAEINISARQLSFWNQTDRTWVLAGGKRTVWVGRDAETRVLVGEVEI